VVGQILYWPALHLLLELECKPPYLRAGFHQDSLPKRMMSMKRCIALAMGFLLVMAADAQISIIGPATPAGDWTTDFDMVQNPGDSAVWTLSIYLAEGLVKFRKNHDWPLNWGDDTFPTGIGILNGPDIPADPGFYLVSFDTSTLAYSFSQGFVGINNESPNVALDISGALANRTAHLDVTSNAATVPSNVGLVNLIGAPTGSVYLEALPGIDGQRLILHNSNTSGQPASFEGTYDIIAGGTIELVFVNAVGWKLTSGGGGSDIFWSQTGATDAISNTNAGGFYSQNPSIVNSDPGPLPLPVSGLGTRLMWMPEKSAMRVGTVLGPKWDADSIGTWSFASGYDAKAKGIFSTAFGAVSSAPGTSSMAMNFGTLASGENSVAMNSLTTASGNNTTSMGYNTKAMGWEAVALGNSTFARSYASLAMGRYNDTIVGSSHNSWVAADPLLTIGNGSSPTTRNNALTIYKNGNFVAKKLTPTNTNPGTLPLPVSGAGTRMMWIPDKSAFRVGTVLGTKWDADSTGTWSFASGYETKAKGTFSTAMGTITTATGASSMAMNWFTVASGENSVAMNSETTASGNNTTSMGYNTKAMGWESVSIGNSTFARSFASLAMGSWNDTIAGSSPNSWIPSDPILSIGNGLGNSLRSNALTIYKNGTSVSKRFDPLLADPGVIPVPVSGVGTRMMWLTEKSAFRVGTVDGAQWDADSIGTWSFASGYNTKAKGLYSTALGFYTEANGFYSTALGDGTRAVGNASVAMGSSSEATNQNSTAMGFSTRSSGWSSTAMGSETESLADISTSMGINTKANSYGALVIGRYNDTIATSNPVFWVATDPVFMVGNGANNETRSNALTIYKNGNLLAKNPNTVSVDPGALPVPESGTGTRMMWLPEKSAFRVGTVTANFWDSPYIGAWSFASGFNTVAFGRYSHAVGFSCSAASDGTTALGYSSQATNAYSTAIGYFTKASGTYSISLGQQTTAMGEASTSTGAQTRALGHYSTSMGLETRVNSYGALGIGQYNDTIPSSNPATWVATDPLLMLGNGTSHSARSNAVVVYKNGNTDISGYTRLGTAAEDAPRIKMKEFSGTTSGTNNGSIPIPHGLNSSKIIGVQALVEYSAGSFVPVAYTYSPELNFNYLITATDIFIVNNATTCAGTSICSKPVKVVVTYKE